MPNFIVTVDLFSGGPSQVQLTIQTFTNQIYLLVTILMVDLLAKVAIKEMSTKSEYGREF